MGFVKRSERDGIATLRLDDGKLNVLTTERFEKIDAAFDDCAEDAAIVLTGRDGCFTAGLDTKTLEELDADGLRELISTFGRTWMRIWLEPRPVVAAVTGHAIAAGTMLAMACDHAVAAQGDFKWGLTETRIGFPLPEFAVALARANVRTDRLEDLLLPGEVVTPDTAVEAGFADGLAAPADTLDTATARAGTLAELPRETYAATKRRLRGQAADNALASLNDDLDVLTAGR